MGSTAGHDEEEYAADTELDEEVNGHRCIEQHRRHYEIGPRPPRQEVCADDSFGKIKFTIPTFDGRYNPDMYLSWELAVDQKFTCHDFPEDKRVRLPLVSLLTLPLFGGLNTIVRTQITHQLGML